MLHLCKEKEGCRACDAITLCCVRGSSWGEGKSRFHDCWVLRRLEGGDKKSRGEGKKFLETYHKEDAMIAG